MKSSSGAFFEAPCFDLLDDYDDDDDDDDGDDEFHRRRGRSIHTHIHITKRIGNMLTKLRRISVEMSTNFSRTIIERNFAESSMECSTTDC